MFLGPEGERALASAAGARGLAVVDAGTPLGASVMAAVTGELGEAPGVAVASSGIGAGVACAARRHAPLLLIAERPADAAAGLSHLKASLEVTPESAGHWIAHGARLAMTEPRGPVRLVLAPGVARAAAMPVAASCRPDPPPVPTAAELDAVAAAIRDAARPLVVAGRRCRAETAPWLRAFAESVPAPVLVTPQGKGALADPHPLALGLVRPGHPLLARADLLIALGADADEMRAEAWPAGARRLAVPGEPALALAELAERLRGERRSDWDVAALDRIKRGLAQAPPVGGGLTLRRLVAIARQATPAGTRATCDLEIADLWPAVWPGDYLADPDTPGFALAAAVAAWLVDPARRAVAVTDASGLTAGEAALATWEALGAPVVGVVAGEEGAATPEEARRAFDAAWRAERPGLVRARLSSNPG